MSVTGQQPANAGLVGRIKGILLTPKEEWARIEGETATVNGLFVGYACILAAIGPLARLIGGQLFGYHALFVSMTPALIPAIVTAIVTYILALAGVFIMALVIDALATSFGGTKDKIAAFKVAVYSSTAAWLAGIFGLFPPLGLLAIVGIYGLYLLYLGLPRLMKAPEDKALGYTAVVVVVYVVILVIVGAVTGVVAGAGAMMTGGVAATSVAASVPTGQVNIGGAQVDLGKLNAAAAQMKAVENGTAKVTPVSVDALKGMLPAGLGSGYARGDVSADSGGVGAVQGSSASGVYTKGDSRITLTITDAAAAGALATLGGAVQVNSDHETSTGYEKVRMDGGRMVDEEWNSQSKTGKYSVMVASRFMVAAEGQGADMNDLKGAVGQVPLDRLQGMAKG